MVLEGDGKMDLLRVFLWAILGVVILATVWDLYRSYCWRRDAEARRRGRQAT
jgi:hypothetical protein